MLKLALSLLLAISPVCASAAPAHALTQQDVVRELIGAPVYSSDGREVGRVMDITLDEDQAFRALLMKASRSLGFGERTVRIPGAAFIALRGAVVLDLPSESMDVLVEHDAEGSVLDER
jgi:sporulation protein YlmC with PRC-barrel domain